MQVEINDDLYKMFVKLIQFLRSNGIEDAIEPVAKSTVAGYIEEGAENLLVDYFNSNDSLWDWNQIYKELKEDYKKYKEKEYASIASR